MYREFVLYAINKCGVTILRMPTAAAAFTVFTPLLTSTRAVYPIYDSYSSALAAHLRKAFSQLQKPNPITCHIISTL